MNKQEKQTKTHRHRQQHGGCRREGRGGVEKSKGGQIQGNGEDLTLDGGHTMRYTDDVS